MSFRRSPLFGALLICLCATTWGVVPLIVRYVHLPPLVAVFYRVLLAALAVAVFVAVRRRWDLLRIPGPATWWLGVLLAIHWSLYFAAIKATSLASAALITYLSPVLMAPLAWIMLKERLHRSTGVAFLLALSGIGLICFSKPGEGVTTLGVCLALGAAVTLAIMLTSIKRFASKVESHTFVIYQSLAAAIVLSPIAAMSSYQISATTLLLLIALGVVITGITGVVFVMALHRVPTTTAGILTYFEPVSAAVLGAIVLGESLTPRIACGGIAILIAGAIVITRSQQQAKRAVATETDPEQTAETEPIAVSSAPARALSNG